MEPADVLAVVVTVDVDVDVDVDVETEAGAIAVVSELVVGRTGATAVAELAELDID